MEQPNTDNRPRNKSPPLPPMPGVVAGNLGEPIRLSGVAIDGVSAEAARGGEMLRVWTRLTLTSDDPVFHRVAEGLSGFVKHHTSLAGAALDLNCVGTLLIVIKPDQTAARTELSGTLSKAKGGYCKSAGPSGCALPSLLRRRQRQNQRILQTSAVLPTTWQTIRSL